MSRPANSQRYDGSPSLVRDSIIGLATLTGSDSSIGCFGFRPRFTAVFGTPNTSCLRIISSGTTGPSASESPFGYSISGSGSGVGSGFNSGVFATIGATGSIGLPSNLRGGGMGVINGFAESIAFIVRSCIGVEMGSRIAIITDLLHQDLDQ